MDLPPPFVYPGTPHVRRHGPRGYKDYREYKPFLRDEFTFRCVYCLEREMWYPNREGSFSTDHFVANAIDPTREADYENLVYACVRCNAFKRERRLALDPIGVPFAAHLRVAEDGQIVALTPDGQDLIDLLHLDAGPAPKVRQLALDVVALKQRYPDDEIVHRTYCHLMGYPEDLPDLKRPQPPGGNSRPNGLRDSHHERRVRGELPEVY